MGPLATRRWRKSRRRARAVAFALTCALGATAVRADGPVREFDIPAQSLESALLAYGDQAEVSVVVSGPAIGEITILPPTTRNGPACSNSASSRSSSSIFVFLRSTPEAS